MVTLRPICTVWLATAILSAGSVTGSLLDTLLSALESAVDCASCHALLIPLQALAHLGNDEFVGTFTTICKTLGVDDDDVCAGAVGAQGPIIAHSLRQISATGRTATLLCDTLFGLCSPPSVAAHTVSFPSVAPNNPKNFVSTGRAPFQVIHFSDVHIDRQYTIGAESNCTKPICCRKYADQSGSITEPAGPNGNSECDSPIALADSMLAAAQSFGSGAKFSIFTGDVVEGAVWLVDESEVTTNLHDFNTEMASKLGSPVYAAVGNHDVAPVNSFPRNTTSTTIDSQWVFDSQSVDWEPWIGSTAASSVDHMSGSYSAVDSATGLKIISINTQYWYKQNFWLYDSNNIQYDPNGILAFLVQELQAAETSGQRVWITGHMPLGKGDALHDQSNYYDQIIQRYKNTIAAQFFGHSHKDQFEIAYTDYLSQTAANADSISFIAPALTPTSGNPAFKIYDIDPDTFEVMDAKTYYSNISDPNFQTSPTWKFYYSARDSYGPLVQAGGLSSTQSLNAAFWHNLTDIFTNDDTAFQLYNTRLSRGGDVSACTGDCKTTTICGLRAARAENNCVAVTPGINFKKRETSQVASHSDCEGHGMKHILEGLPGLLNIGNIDAGALRESIVRAVPTLNST